ncbi:MAG: hypothetical protein KME59_04390 [Trichormus sp. ATA11-4-KO1]|nr:hypothetical protein [Trichormus sp. ATA11-4-KO1]
MQNKLSSQERGQVTGFTVSVSVRLSAHAEVRTVTGDSMRIQRFHFEFCKALAGMAALTAQRAGGSILNFELIHT